MLLPRFKPHSLVRAISLKNTKLLSRSGAIALLFTPLVHATPKEIVGDHSLVFGAGTSYESTTRMKAQSSSGTELLFLVSWDQGHAFKKVESWNSDLQFCGSDFSSCSSAQPTAANPIPKGLQHFRWMDDDYTYDISARFQNSLQNSRGVTYNVVHLLNTKGTPNPKPVISDNSPLASAADEDIPLTLNLNATDASTSDLLTWSISGNASNGSAVVASDPTGTSQVITYTPNANFNGSDSFDVMVVDGSTGSDSITVNVTVNSVNDTPTASAQSININEDTAAAITLAGSDVDTDDSLLTFSIADQPANGTLLGSGANISYTPNANFNGSDSFTFIANDGNSDSAPATVSISVAEQNDAPIISGNPDRLIAINQTYSFIPTVIDIDGKPGEILAFSVRNLPSWASFNPATGEVSGVASEVGRYDDIEITVQDPIGAVSSSGRFSIDVKTDLDGDGIADDIDTDTDGDGISNEYELTNGLDPLDASDAALDSDGDGVSNLDEFLVGTNAQQDDHGPVINASNVSIDATSLLTRLPQGLADAEDAVDGSVNVSHDLISELLPAGRHIITWTAQDVAGNTTELEQTLDIRPLANFQVDQQAAEGNDVTVALSLNGLAPQYPVVANYTITGTANNPDDHNVQTGSVQINSGISASIDVSIVTDDFAEGDEDIIFTLDSISNAVIGEQSTHTVTISESNHAPRVTLNAVNDGDTQQRTLFASNSGLVVIKAQVKDSDAGDTHSFNWQADNALSGSSDGSQFSFDPAVAGVGVYQISVKVGDDDALHSKFGSGVITLTVLDKLPGLSNSTDTNGNGLNDQSVGTGDQDGDNVPDFADSLASSNLLSMYPLGRVPSDGAWYVESQPGIKLQLNVYGSNSGAYSPLVESVDLVDGNQVNHSDHGFKYNVGIFDFVISNMPVQGESVHVVIPQVNAIPANAVYRKEKQGVWGDFIEDDKNQLSSATGELGVCPPPGSNAYLQGLTTGDFCVQLTIEDGGPNDSDGTVDGNIIDPGGVGIALPTSVKSSKGGGSLDFSLLALLTALAARVLMRRKPHASKNRNTTTGA